MRKLYYYLFFVSFLAFSCSKDGMFDNSQVIDQQLSKTFVMYSGSVFKVFPNGKDDTKKILDAFDKAKAAGPGSVVQLAAGTYKIGFIEVWDFQGIFRGAGKGKTIITNLPDLPQGEVFSGNSIYPALLKFVGGNFSMTDMTIHLNDGNAVALPDPVGDLYCILFLAESSVHHTPPFKKFKASVDNIDFIAGYDGGTGFSPFSSSTMFNVWSSIMISNDDQWGLLPTKGDAEISITRCKMENDVFGTWIWGFNQESSANIENNQFTGGAMQILMASCFGSEIKIKNNQFRKGSFNDLCVDSWNWLGWIPDFTLTKRAHFTITGNNFQSPQGVISLYMNDAFRPLFPDEGFPQLFDVMGNNFDTRNGGMAIQSLNNVDARILNNKFSGTGAVGVSIDGVDGNSTTDPPTTTTFAENINLIGNSFFAATYTDASVYLGPYSRNCKVVGANVDKVVDNGVNNSIIGVRPYKGFEHSGQHHDYDFSSIHEKLRRIGKH